MGLLESLRNRGGLLGTVGQTLTDYQQLANAYPNASKFAEGLIKNLSAVAPPDPRNQQQSMQYAINRAFDVPGGFGGAISSQAEWLDGLRKKASKSSVIDFLVDNLGEATSSHIKYGVDPSKKANGSITINQLDPSEWDNWDEYKTWSGNTMIGSKDKIAKMATAIQRGESLPPVLVNGLSDDPKLRPQVIDGHHRVAAYLAAGENDVPVIYNLETLVNLWAKANGMKVDSNGIKMAENWLDSALKKMAE